MNKYWQKTALMVTSESATMSPPSCSQAAQRTGMAQLPLDRHILTHPSLTAALRQQISVPRPQILFSTLNHHWFSLTWEENKSINRIKNHYNANDQKRANHRYFCDIRLKRGSNVIRRRCQFARRRCDKLWHGVKVNAKGFHLSWLG